MKVTRQFEIGFKLAAEQFIEIARETFNQHLASMLEARANEDIDAGELALLKTWHEDLIGKMRFHGLLPKAQRVFRHRSRTISKAVKP